MKTLQQLIKSKKFDWVNPEIEKGGFDVIERSHGEYKLFHFNKYISSEDAVKKMEKEGYMPATTRELVEWQDWNDKDWVVALGSVAEVVGGRGVPCLGKYGSRRDLFLSLWDDDWDGYYRFLAVRNLDFKLSGTLSSGSRKLGHLDTRGTLETRIKTLESQMESLRKVINI